MSPRCWRTQRAASPTRSATAPSPPTNTASPDPSRKLGRRGLVGQQLEQGGGGGVLVAAGQGVVVALDPGAQGGPLGRLHLVRRCRPRGTVAGDDRGAGERVGGEPDLARGGDAY